MKMDITHKGETIEVDIDPSLTSMTLQESVRLEEALGIAVFDRVMNNTDVHGTVSLPARPTLIRAILWSKLASLLPGIGIDGFDIDLSSVVEEITDVDEGDVSIPMTTPDGDTVDAVVDLAAAGKG